MTLLLVFDTRPSMDYKQNDLTRLDLAKKRCLELLDQLPDDCRVLLLETAPAENGRAEWVKSLAKVRQKINGLAIRPESTTVTQTLQVALRRLEEWQRGDDDPAGVALPRFLCVFSDRTQASWDDGEAVTVKKHLAKETDVRTRPLFFDVGVDEPVDSAIVRLDLPLAPDGRLRQSFVAGEKVPLRGRTCNRQANRIHAAHR